ncbi:MAG: thioredoxin [Clostridia bacterium]|nr:thioredoxin [Clostridia bacterium]
MTEVVITKDNFVDEVLKSGTPVLLDFWAEWCGPCSMLSPVVEEFADTHDDIKVGKVNVDEQPELADTFSVSSIPALFALRDGEVFAQRVGYCSREDIEALFK